MSNLGISMEPVMDAEASEAIRRRMVSIFVRHFDGEGSTETAVPGLSLHRRMSMAAPASFLYEPSLALIVRGEKRVILGHETYHYDQAHFLLTALDLPTVVQVLNATQTDPYISIKQVIDLELARELIAEVDQLRYSTTANEPAWAVGHVTAQLLNAALRLLELVDRPQDIPILSRSIQREIIYRALVSPVGARLRQVVEVGTQTNRVSAAVRWLRDHFQQPFRVEQLAEIAGLGESTLHHHFRALTAMSPLQYQKHLRLHEARRLMITERLDAGSAALRVGYESATQFNREYRRLFGVPPKTDIRAILAVA
ncbi:AraC family transcriptional regulator [Neorhizobium sp. P12A]|uniref:AraC family transcriptional regulator n=1 Tax=Neorhizobium sp. P12A TaxID=2268027 RepID=UPI0011EF11A8|nr:AraC family transcriptional regulator [Neorhizobium sp. P12A]